MRLWIDDVRPCPKDYQLWAKNSQEAFHFLETEKITHISFDNDLGPESMEGYEICKWIEEQAFKGTLPRMTWNIHSANPVGRKAIEGNMRNADDWWDSQEAGVNPYELLKDRLSR